MSMEALLRDLVGCVGGGAEARDLSITGATAYIHKLTMQRLSLLSMVMQR